MDTRIRELLGQIGALEDELRTAMHQRESRVLFQIKGKRVEFERGIHAAHRKLQRSFIYWMLTDRPENFITGPFIYSLGIPLVLLDLVVTIYQAVCFPIYKIAKVRRADYIVFDRHHLGYLNWFERFHCEYCAYANGLLAYVSEITARTEQYFCPIKHAHKVLGTHARYTRFLDFGEAGDYHGNLEQYRLALAQEMVDVPPAKPASGG